MFNVKMTVENAIGCIDEIEKQVIVVPQPTVSWMPDTACVNDALNFSAAITPALSNCSKLFMGYR